MKSRQANTASTSTCAVAAASLAACAASPGRSSVLDGMQAQYEHSPPTSSRSTSATRRPPSARAAAQCSARRPAPDDDHVEVVPHGRFSFSFVGFVTVRAAAPEASAAPPGNPLRWRCPRRAASPCRCGTAGRGRRRRPGRTSHATGPSSPSNPPFATGRVPAAQRGSRAGPRLLPGHRVPTPGTAATATSGSSTTRLRIAAW